MSAVQFNSNTILLTFDVEDWFQVENFKKYIPYSSWSSRELRVEKNIKDILDLLDTSPTPVRATFFILGWIAERCPSLVSDIHKRGHEVASHGFDHHLCSNQSSDELRRDLIRSKELLENIIGNKVFGYRAPSFSISDEVINIIKKVGYLYDSSYNSYKGHGRYGSLTLPEIERKDLPLYRLSSSFYEIPVSNLRVGSIIIPWGGGGYFRLLPSLVHRAGVRRIVKQTGCYTFYMHPWEIDPDQPRLNNIKPFFRFRHYVNLGGAKGKLKKLMISNAKCSFLTCNEFVNNSTHAKH